MQFDLTKVQAQVILGQLDIALHETVQHNPNDEKQIQFLQDLRLSLLQQLRFNMSPRIPSKESS